MKKWIIHENECDTTEYHENRLINSLLYARGIRNSRDAEDFLYPKLSKLHNPYLLKNMEQAIEKIDRCIKKRGKIIIYGDYDVDGITSTSILVRALQKLGVDVGYYIPDRMSEGYGINKNAIQYIKTLQAQLIITVDCGITSVDEVKHAMELGIDIIITDHHEPKDQLPATLVINPKQPGCDYPNKNLAGCGIAFKLVQALWQFYNLSGYDEFLDIAAIGTIADVVKLTGENRILVSHGLQRINKSDKCGIRALIQVAALKDEINSYHIAFQIAPRLNAVGRLSDAKIAVDLFTTNDYDKALQIAKFLDNENKRRQTIEEDILKDALLMLSDGSAYEEDKVLVLVSDKWHHGVVGIVASKLVERFHKPVLMLCREGELCKGSGRSISGFNLFQALSAAAGILKKFGGHEMAAGLTIEYKRINELQRALNQFGEMLDAGIYLEILHAELQTETEEVTLQTAELLRLFEPFGNGNYAPILYMENLEVVSLRGIGGKAQHLKARFRKNETEFDGILFNRSDQYLNKGLVNVDAVFSMDINEWNQERKLQLMLKDLRNNKEALRVSVGNHFLRYFKQMLTEDKSECDLDFILFEEKKEAFLRDFLIRKKGVVYVSGLPGFLELETMVADMEFGISTSQCIHGSQIVICPDLRAMPAEPRDILIYDFLPGLSEYACCEKLSMKKIYHFFEPSEEGLRAIDAALREVEIDEFFLIAFLSSLAEQEMIASLMDLAVRFKRNPYQMHRLLTILKENKFCELHIKNDILKIRGTLLDREKIIQVVHEDIYVKKLKKVRIKLAECWGV